MKRSEAIKKLIHKVVSPFEIIKQEYYDTGLYEQRAENLLEYITKEIGMLPPPVKKERIRKFGDAPGNLVDTIYEWEEE